MKTIKITKNNVSPHHKLILDNCLTIKKLKVLIADLPDDMIIAKDFDDVEIRIAYSGEVRDEIEIDDVKRSYPEVDEFIDETEYFVID